MIHRPQYRPEIHRFMLKYALILVGAAIVLPTVSRWIGASDDFIIAIAFIPLAIGLTVLAMAMTYYLFARR